MIEQIQTTTSRSGTKVHSIADTDKGVPYCAVHVNTDGDYWLTVYGRYSFAFSAHSKILEVVKPTGKNITAEMFYKKH
ncbi:hypothetical protein VWH97_06010 [Escherichia coli O157]|nr:hypothetical protein [Escherichia coli O157]